MNGKLQVLSAILKVADKPFRPPHIVDMTGLDRQLVRYHIDRFVEANLIEKIDKFYVVKDKEGLLNSLIESSERLETALPKPGGFFGKVETINNRAEYLVAAKSLNLPMHNEAKDAFLSDIDATMRILKQLRKYITNSTKTVGSAQKFLYQMGGTKPEHIEGLWKLLCMGVVNVVDLPEFEEAYKEAMVPE